ncbi:hypothetical protein DZA31_00020 [Arcobacter sp. HD9-500m-PIT-SAG02]|nr:hypothetical protein DZA31_00020 [Arcobacter sp. HD9-500m-PIT-SAG02]
MARKERITIAGYYHIINRGVEKRNIFMQDEDYDVFMDILENILERFNIELQSYCLMTNHYHILLKTNESNISNAIKQLNLTYTKYFNKKYKRVGHLWQGRFFSTFLYDDLHCFDVSKYIERNPIKANIVSDIKNYKYQSFYQRKTKGKYLKLLNKSITLDMRLDEYETYIKNEFKEDVFDTIYKSPNIIKKDGDIKVLYKRLETFFDNTTKIDENIKNSYNYGYTNAQISKYLNISHTKVSRICSK